MMIELVVVVVVVVVIVVVIPFWMLCKMFVGDLLTPINVW